MGEIGVLWTKGSDVFAGCILVSNQFCLKVASVNHFNLIIILSVIDGIIPNEESHSMNEISLHFHGPLKFSSIAQSEYSASEGVYLWVIRDIEHDRNYIHYVGENTNLGRRHREHLTQILGLNYSITDSDQAQQGIHEVLWSGMWRDKTPEAMVRTIEEYDSLKEKVSSYVDCIDIYFAETIQEGDLRKHIEGSIGWDLRTRHPELNNFYPADNHVAMAKDPCGGVLRISSDEPILGLAEILEI